MIVLINKDKNLSLAKKRDDYFSSQITHELQKFNSHITTVEVYLKYENEKNNGYNPVSCSLEAKLVGRYPVIVTNQADTIEHAVMEANDKLKSAIDKVFEKK
jgi:ribosome-associated translation inhibitor RaiA